MQFQWPWLIFQAQGSLKTTVEVIFFLSKCESTEHVFCMLCSWLIGVTGWVVVTDLIFAKQTNGLVGFHGNGCALSYLLITSVLASPPKLPFSASVHTHTHTHTDTHKHSHTHTHIRSNSCYPRYRVFFLILGFSSSSIALYVSPIPPPSHPFLVPFSGLENHPFLIGASGILLFLPC